MLNNYNKIWSKVKSLINKDLDGELDYGDKYLKTKMKSYKNVIKTNFWW